MNGFLVVLAVAAAPPLLVLIWAVVVYNRFIRVRQHIEESWSGIDVELKRRYDVIPRLVETVKGYARHEREVLERVIQVRNRAAAPHATAADQAVDETALQMELKRLFALVEAYPQLKADTHFLALQKELALTEDRIAASRRFYNANVREMNQLRRTFPTNVIGNLFKFQDGTFFELSSEAERVAPRVQV